MEKNTGYYNCIHCSKDRTEQSMSATCEKCRSKEIEDLKSTYCKMFDEMRVVVTAQSGEATLAAVKRVVADRDTCLSELANTKALLKAERDAQSREVDCAEKAEAELVEAERAFVAAERQMAGVHRRLESLEYRTGELEKVTGLAAGWKKNE